MGSHEDQTKAVCEGESMTLPEDEDIPDIKYTCDECGERCDIGEDTWDYAGTHCNNGQPGVHRTGVWSSVCCDAGYDAVLID